MKQTACVFCLLFMVGPSNGQSVIAFAPWEVGVKVSSVTQLDVLDPYLSIRRVVPVETLLPQVTADSFIHVLGIGLGPRFFDSDYDRLRFRLTAADIFMQRAYTSGSFTLLDFNRTGVIEEQTVWIGASFGPGFHVRERAFSAWFRGKAGGQLATQKSGTLLFSGNSEAHTTKTGFVYNLTLQAGVQFHQKVQLQVSHLVNRLRVLDFDQNLFKVEGKLRIDSRFELVVDFRKGTYELAHQSKKADQLSGTIRFTPSAKGF